MRRNHPRQRFGFVRLQTCFKNMTRRWLMQHPDVLAYIEPREGNDGAVRILLKRRRREDEE